MWVDYVLGFTELVLDRPDAAIAAWTRVRTARPDHEPVYFDLADAYLRAERSADALAVLRDAARRWPSDPETHNAVGVVLLGRGATDDAIESFERAIAAAPRESLGYFNLGRARHARYVRLLGSVGPGSVTAARTLADRERRQAAEAYTKYLEIGGPYERQAREALTLLNWGK